MSSLITSQTRCLLTGSRPVVGSSRNSTGGRVTNPSLPLRDRVRMAASLGTVFGGLLMAGDAFDNVSSAELGALVRDAVHDVLAGHSA
jgi:hypothetical protein